MAGGVGAGMVGWEAKACLWDSCLLSLGISQPWDHSLSRIMGPSIRASQMQKIRTYSQYTQVQCTSAFDRYTSQK